MSGLNLSNLAGSVILFVAAVFVAAGWFDPQRLTIVIIFVSYGITLLDKALGDKYDL